MCGITGIKSVSNKVNIDLAVLKTMTDAIARRGPDDEGFMLRKNTGLGMRRLSIIDLAGGHQPISNEDNSVWIVFNGEIYNYPQLRKNLITKGHTFKTNSDTEVLVHLYEDEKESMLNHIRGMFTFAIWDEKADKLFIARDRVGIKPLFYHFHEGTLIFSSEMKSILASGLYKREVSFVGMDYYFTFGYIPAPHTIFSGINKLLPGHYLVYEKGNINIRQYWDLKYSFDHTKDEREWIELFVEKFRESVRMHMISDVPLGAFLSGGIDSALIVAMMSEYSSNRVNTFTMGFGGNKGGYNDERPSAKLIADYFGTNHNELESSPDLKNIIDDIVTSFDEPFSDDSVIPSYYICREARKHVKVALTGLGGDELFGGYERYLGLKLDSYYSYLPLFVRDKILGNLIFPIRERSDGNYTVNHIKRFVKNSLLPPDYKYIGYNSILTGEDKDIFYQNRIKEEIDSKNAGSNVLYDYYNKYATQDYLVKASYCDIKTYLPEDILALSDRLSMFHSLELRVPFVDHKVMELCVSIPSKFKIRGMKKKYLLRKVAEQYLPTEIINSKKQGFAAPMTSWIKNDLKDYVYERLSKENLSVHGYFNTDFIHRKIRDHIDGKEINDKFIFSQLIFQHWYEAYMT